MSDYKTPIEEELATVKLRFSELSQTEDLIDSVQFRASEQTNAVSPSALFAYANGSNNETVEAALAENLALRRVFRDMVGNTARYYVPEAMAASSTSTVEDFISRSGKGCKIRMEPSRAEPNQIYVIIELASTEKVPPTTLVVCDIESNCSRFSLPKIRDGVMQIIVDRESELVRLLSDPKTEAFIR